MTECTECSEQLDVVVNHHVDYENDTTVPVCRACHNTIHATPDHPLYPNGRGENTCIRLSGPLADELFDRKQRRGESYADVIWRLVEKADEYDEVRNE